ncbi:hypothetical protein THAOC_25319 [Thalassiosira oceanica]|uniref:Uncharacterized protein n=1 Tax=Thalassiosira oceanica TaxID=159749 RepID=K0RPF4_THAOC|nr:hypothetical protein THAOC_25319 [Thalassiosira oceanica]|eukprot:EJK55000.1 hypothetical protein THAOC_25319 [Thalassiosira oceanica]
MLSPIRPKVYVPTQFRRCMEPLTIKQRLSDVVKAIKKRSPHRQDSNLRGRSPVDFESTSLTTRTRCVVICVDILQFMKFMTRTMLFWELFVVPITILKFGLKLLSRQIGRSPPSTKDTVKLRTVSAFD